MCLWDLPQQKLLAKRLLPGAATGLAWHPCSNALAIATEDGGLIHFFGWACMLGAWWQEGRLLEEAAVRHRGGLAVEGAHEGSLGSKQAGGEHSGLIHRLRWVICACLSHLAPPPPPQKKLSAALSCRRQGHQAAAAR